MNGVSCTIKRATEICVFGLFAPFPHLMANRLPIQRVLAFGQLSEVDVIGQLDKLIPEILPVIVDTCSQSCQLFWRTDKIRTCLSALTGQVLVGRAVPIGLCLCRQSADKQQK